jgi:hypothetical protein
MKRLLAASNGAFFAAFAAGILVRLSVLVAAVCLLRKERYIIIIAFAAAVILVQTAFELVPLRKNGSERNS